MQTLTFQSSSKTTRHGHRIVVERDHESSAPTFDVFAGGRLAFSSSSMVDAQNMADAIWGVLTKCGGGPIDGITYAATCVSEARICHVSSRTLTDLCLPFVDRI